MRGEEKEEKEGVRVRQEENNASMEEGEGGREGGRDDELR